MDGEMPTDTDTLAGPPGDRETVPPGPPPGAGREQATPQAPELVGAQGPLAVPRGGGRAGSPLPSPAASPSPSSSSSLPLLPPPFSSSFLLTRMLESNSFGDDFYSRLILTLAGITQ